ncbi:MAG: redoxin domain-containing protein [Chloroflexi bacterium]|nr:redoxin domain-containing protein [Chloroflexota bacterium]
MKKAYPRLQAADAEVLAISADSIHSHRVFAEQLGGLPFPLLSDWGRTVAPSYGVWNAERHTPIRSAFVVDREGILRFANPRFDARDEHHYEQVIQAVEQLP